MPSRLRRVFFFFFAAKIRRVKPRQSALSRRHNKGGWGRSDPRAKPTQQFCAEPSEACESCVTLVERKKANFFLFRLCLILKKKSEKYKTHLHFPLEYSEPCLAHRATEIGARDERLRNGAGPAQTHTHGRLYYHSGSKFRPPQCKRRNTLPSPPTITLLAADKRRNTSISRTHTHTRNNHDGGSQTADNRQSDTV